MDRIYLVDIQTNEIIDEGVQIYSVGSKVIYVSENETKFEDEVSLKVLKMIKEQMKVVNEKNIIKQNDMVKQTIKRIKMTGSDQLKKQCDLIYKNLRIANKNGILKIKVFNDDELQRFNNIKGIINDLKKL